MVKVMMRRVLKMHITMGKKAGGLFAAASSGGEKQTKVMPALPAAAVKDAEETGAKTTPNRLEMRRQKTREMAALNREDAETANWL